MNEDVANEILIGMLGIVLHAIKIVAAILAGIFFFGISTSSHNRNNGTGNDN